jgi:hypothetical protein
MSEICPIGLCNVAVLRPFSCRNGCIHLVCDSHFKKLLGQVGKVSVATQENEDWCFVEFYESESEDEETESEDLTCSMENNHDFMKEFLGVEQEVD